MTLIERASTIATVISEINASTVIKALAQRVNGMTSAGLKAVESAVSYTHLDVYKRQRPFGPQRDVEIGRRHGKEILRDRRRRIGIEVAARDSDRFHKL